MKSDSGWISEIAATKSLPFSMDLLEIHSRPRFFWEAKIKAVALAAPPAPKIKTLNASRLSKKALNSKVAYEPLKPMLLRHPCYIQLIYLRYLLQLY